MNNPRKTDALEETELLFVFKGQRRVQDSLGLSSARTRRDQGRALLLISS